MKEYNESNNGENGTSQSFQFAEILNRLDSIQKRLDKSEQFSQYQWTFSIGVAGVATGAGLVTSGAALSDNHILWGGVVVFILGFLTMIRRKMVATK